MAIRHIIFPMILVLLSTYLAIGQQVERKTYFDDDEQKVKEIYHVKSENTKVLHGPYTAFYENGNTKTIGQYFENTSNGAWEFYYESGELKMRGTIKDGNNVGLWEYFFANGRKSMEGKILNGKREGPWKMYYQNGAVKSEGQFESGSKTGDWTYYDEKGKLISSAFYTQSVGQYEEYYLTGTVKASGDKLNSRRIGEWEYFYEDGTQQAVGHYNAGLKDGQWKYFNKEGILVSEGSYSQDQQSGLWIDYHDNGTVSSRGNYEHGQKHGNWSLFYSDGTSRGEGTFVNGTGSYKEYHMNGEVKLTGQLENGKNQGEWNYFYENGKKEGICEFDQGEGQYIGYYSDGKIKMKGTLRNNERIGIWELYKEDGSIAGYYKPYYENGNPSLWLAEDSEKQQSLRVEQGRKAGSYKYKTKKFNYFDSKVNEFRAVIINYNPVAPILNSLPIGVEYYHQERLGHELFFNYIRDPFFRSHSGLDVGENYKQGGEIAIRQKLYNRARRTGSPYFGHEIRYSDVTHSVKSMDQNDPTNFPILNQREQKYEYSILLGNRYFKSPKEGGMTLDTYIGIGVGYRNLSKDFDPTEENNAYFSDVPTSNFSVQFRFGVNLGFAIPVRR